MPIIAVDSQIAKYEAAIAQDENVNVINYWWLGISYLLSGDYEEAQATWFVPFSNANSEIEVQELNDTLESTLISAAKEQTALGDYRAALQLRQQFQEINSLSFENILELVLLSDCFGELQPENITGWQLKEAAMSLNSPISIDSGLLSMAFEKMLFVITIDNMEDILSCISCSETPKNFIDLLVAGAVERKYGFNGSWVLVLENCLRFQPDHLGVLHYLSVMYSYQQEFDKSIQVAEKYYELCTDKLDKIHGYYLLIRALMEASDFNRVTEVMVGYQELLVEILDNPPKGNLISSYQALVTTPAFFPYLQDQPEQHRSYFNKAGEIYQNCLRESISEAKTFNKEAHNNSNKTIRIGYIAGTLYTHSVGWLSRWLWEYHNQSEFEVFTYFVNGDSTNLFTRKWFQEKSHTSYYVGGDATVIADLIRENEIDILIDLDSVTDSITYEVMARRSAPVQITWLGWDASGCSEVDYFIADPYVLPKNAQSYYQEKIWRLPETYIAVDGFEIGIPSIKRADFGLDISDIIYFSAQKGFKLNKDNIIAQMQIIKHVPNAHLLVKARGDNDTSKKLYFSLADQVGLDFSCIHFLGRDADEMTHRANLQIADVVLDTFPYNGATTTLETLWLGIPMVTKVGEQFAARNAYGFMMNAGITEGIAETVDEYINWGIRLGTDSELRQHIREKLRLSRETSPLWNAQNFTRQMEKAYKEMWEIYQRK
jgi:predicted O-linked N-acetylglucosamine transferase (SPINDLY family)